MLRKAADCLRKCPGRSEVVWRGERFARADPRSRFAVPYLDYRDPSGSFECAVYINHIAPCFGTFLVEQYFAFDPRVRPMCKFILHWARMKSIMSAQRGFLSSYALILMVVFFLQIQREPVVDSVQMYADATVAKANAVEIPSFHNLLKRKPQWGENIRFRPENVYTDTVNLNFMKVDVASMRQKLGYPKNRESVGELLTKFFYYFGVDYPVCNRRSNNMVGIGGTERDAEDQRAEQEVPADRAGDGNAVRLLHRRPGQP